MPQQSMGRDPGPGVYKEEPAPVVDPPVPGAPEGPLVPKHMIHGMQHLPRHYRCTVTLV
ncbi:MAG: hypothetical protein Q9186_002904 [Xanthomendoza sp. 1 TL-2023]